MAADSSVSWTTVPGFLQDSDAQTARCFRRVRWDRLCSIASNANRGLKCVPLDRVASGLNNVVRELEFSDQTRWAARVPIERGGPPQARRIKLGDEVATMQFITERSSLPVPRVLTYDTDEDNAAAAPFMLIEVLPGIVAMDALGGYAEHRGVIPTRDRQTFYQSVAKCHVQMTALRLPKIGAIIRSPDAGYESGPLPGIGGPFDTAAAFFEAWADTVEFKWDKETITRMMQRGPISAERMVAIIDGFPRRIKAMAGRLSRHNEGPFPLCHGDFLHINIMVDEASFNVTGVIDWEDACTVPWELVAFPEFLQAMPPSFDLPQHYGWDGQPLGREARERWRERREYVEMVKSAERDSGGDDDLLSAHLGSDRSQALAYSYGAFTSTGKLGFYERVMEEMEKGV